MSPQVPPAGERWVCPKCTGVSGGHYLTCPVLRLPQDKPLYSEAST